MTTVSPTQPSLFRRFIQVSATPMGQMPHMQQRGVSSAAAEEQASTSFVKNALFKSTHLDIAGYVSLLMGALFGVPKALKAGKSVVIEAVASIGTFGACQVLNYLGKRANETAASTTSNPHNPPPLVPAGSAANQAPVPVIIADSFIDKSDREGRRAA